MMQQQVQVQMQERDLPSRHWPGRLIMRFGRSAGRSVLTALEHAGPLRVQQLFYPEKTSSGPLPCHCCIVHPPGALVNGDDLLQQITVTDGARVLITTPAAGKFYKSAGPLQRQRVCISVQEGELAWLPQETLFYDRARAGVSLEAEVSPQAAFVGAEISCLGRFDMGELFTHGYLDSSTSLSREGRPLLHERLRLDPERFLFSSPFTVHNQPCLLSLNALPAQSGADILGALGAALQQRLGSMRLQGLTGAGCRAGLLCVRYLGGSLTEAALVRQTALELIYPALFGRSFTIPRIWNT